MTLSNHGRSQEIQKNKTWGQGDVQCTPTRVPCSNLIEPGTSSVQRSVLTHYGDERGIRISLKQRAEWGVVSKEHTTLVLNSTCSQYASTKAPLKTLEIEIHSI